MLCYVLGSPPSLGARSEGSPQLSSLTPSSLPSLPSHLSIPGSLEPAWGLRKPPACSPCCQLAPLAPLAARASLGLWNLPATSGSPQLAPLLPEHPWVPGTFLGPQKAPSLLLSLPAYPLAPRASLGPWNLTEASGSSQLAPLTPSLLPLLPEYPWVPGASWEQGEQAGSEGSKLGARGASWSELE